MNPIGRLIRNFILFVMENEKEIFNCCKSWPGQEICSNFVYSEQNFASFSKLLHFRANQTKFLWLSTNWKAQSTHSKCLSTAIICLIWITLVGTLYAAANVDKPCREPEKHPKIILSSTTCCYCCCFVLYNSSLFSSSTQLAESLLLSTFFVGKKLWER